MAPTKRITTATVEMGFQLALRPENEGTVITSDGSSASSSSRNICGGSSLGITPENHGSSSSGSSTTVSGISGSGSSSTTISASRTSSSASSSSGSSSAGASLLTRAISRSIASSMSSGPREVLAAGALSGASGEPSSLLINSSFLPDTRRLRSLHIWRSSLTFIEDRVSRSGVSSEAIRLTPSLMRRLSTPSASCCAGRALVGVRASPDAKPSRSAVGRRKAWTRA